jgi:hypothetical protein
MNRKGGKIFGIYLIVLFFGCAGTVNTSGTNIAKFKEQPAFLVCDHELNDYSIHNAISFELMNRGFKVVDLSDKQPDNVSGVVVHYMDHWKWDMVMYLDNLQVRILNGTSGEVLAIGSYQNSGLHSFPDSVKVVGEIFSNFDAKGVFE